jgi:hypothetical protein
MTRPLPFLLLVFASVFGAILPVQAQTALEILPQDVVLHGAKSSQRLIVEAKSQSEWTGDRTQNAAWVSSNPAVAKVDKAGTVRAIGDGTATVTATVGGQKTTRKIIVRGTRTATVRNFRNEVLPALTKAGCSMGACHGALAGKGGLKLTLRGYDPEADFAVLTRQANGRRTVPGDPQNSLLLLKSSMQVVHGGGPRLSRKSADYALISDWIRQGTPRPKPTDAAVQNLGVFPAQTSLMKPGDTQQIVVQAEYSDGRKTDVTHWAKFGSSDGTVASVDDNGKVTVNGYGEAAITVWFSSRVTYARIVSPFPNKVAAETFQNAPRANFIDELILAKLQSLNIPPSPRAGDREWIRRAYLDTLGILPTPAETEKFVADAAPDKRAKLIDSLLARPEFTDYWTYKWSDLLLVSSRELSGGAMTTFSGYIKNSVADNKPWDKFVREIITARGSTLENGAANYYVLHKDPIALTETTTQAFLGMSLTCARCHNHPLEKWTQSQYYGMANLLSRVRLKNGERAGEVLVLASDQGDIAHPRTGKPMPPTPLDAEAMNLADTADRREKLAEWLTAKDNPYFSRALVNRVWRHFMGRGLVENEDDLRATNPASNEPLFAALSERFAADGFDVKSLIRTIMLSEAYQRTATPVAGNERDGVYYSRTIVRRLPAEVMLDAISQVTGISTEFAGYAKGTRALQLPDSQVVSTFLSAFGRPERVQTCSCERQQEPSIAQALHLANGDTVNQKLRMSGGVIDTLLDANTPNERILEQLYLSALSRPPTEGERAKALQVLNEPTDGSRAARRLVLEDLFWAVLTDKEFLFNH